MSGKIMIPLRYKRNQYVKQVIYQSKKRWRTNSIEDASTTSKTSLSRGKKIVPVKDDEIELLCKKLQIYHTKRCYQFISLRNKEIQK